eukprot:scaffold228874_cov50-Prasinocladus_malaysianus.AAC.2
MEKMHTIQQLLLLYVRFVAKNFRLQAYPHNALNEPEYSTGTTRFLSYQLNSKPGAAKFVSSRLLPYRMGRLPAWTCVLYEYE